MNATTTKLLGALLAAALLAACGKGDEVSVPSVVGAQGTPALSRPASTPPAVPPGEEELPSRVDQAEARAGELLAAIGQAHQARDRAAYEAAVAALREEAWDALGARRFAVKLGLAQAARAEQMEGEARLAALDKARRLLSRGVWLPEYFDEAGRPTAARGDLVARIQDLNLSVMTFNKQKGGGLDGVTRPYEVPSGEAPLTTVSRQRLPYGPNALLFWNKGNLDPRRVQAAEILLLPVEELHVVVSRRYRRLAIFIGDWFVKDWPVGIGRPDKPTPGGVFRVGKKREENPDWWGPEGVIRYGDPRNELGSMWIGIESDRVPESAGIGIHGTNRPDTVGTRCSNGCVRLENAAATELYRWMRGRDGNGGEPTRIEIL